MKRFISAISAAAVLVSMAAAPMSVFADEQKSVNVLVNNELVEFDQPPVIIDGSTMVPVRAVFEQAGADVTWDQENQTAMLVRGGYTVTIKLNDTVLYKNGTPVALSVPASIINDRVLIPVRAIGEAMDFSIAWDGYNYTVLVGTDGKNYRPYGARRNHGFLALNEAADFYSDQSFAWKNMDTNGDGVDETVAFTRTMDSANEEAPLLIIDGKDFTEQLSFMPSTYSFAIVDTKQADAAKEIVITSTSDCFTAYFFRYKDGELQPILRNGSQSAIKYVSRLFFDNASYVLSDLDGFCFTDIMLTSAAYQISGDENVMNMYKVSNAANMIPRKLIHSYNDNMVYNYYITDKFEGGTYVNKKPSGTINAADIKEFTVTDMYVDDYNPAYSEYFVTMPDGTKMVLSAFSA